MARLLWQQLKEGAGAAYPGSPRRKRSVEAKQLLDVFGVKGPPVDVRRIADELGVLVHVVSNPGWAGAVKSAGERADVWLCAEDAPVRQRFTLAHELGHLFLHPGLEFRDTTFAGGPKEVEANRFAADLLMPIWMVAAQAERLGYSVTRLSSIFGVSAQAMQIRLTKLGVG